MSHVTEDPKNIKVCPVCQHENRTGALVCDECGSLLSTDTQRRQGTRKLNPAERQAQQAAEAEGGHQNNKTIPTSGVYQKGMAVQLFVDGVFDPVTLTPSQLTSQVIVGRYDPITQYSPAVDLTKLRSNIKGISRKHCSLQIIQGRLTVADLGSSNGTYLNDKRLITRRLDVVVNGDVIRLGQLRMVVQFAYLD
jgi:hypothetical protein